MSLQLFFPPKEWSVWSIFISCPLNLVYPLFLFTCLFLLVLRSSGSRGPSHVAACPCITSSWNSSEQRGQGTISPAGASWNASLASGRVRSCACALVSARTARGVRRPCVSVSTLVKQSHALLPPATEGNVFSRVCHFVVWKGGLPFDHYRTETHSSPPLNW